MKRLAIKDDWRPVCLRCPLEDCIRPEGYFGRTNYGNMTPESRERALGDYPIYQCEERGISPAQAVNGKAEELGLLEPVEWMEI